MAFIQPTHNSSASVSSADISSTILQSHCKSTDEILVQTPRNCHDSSDIRPCHPTTSGICYKWPKYSRETTLLSGASTQVGADGDYQNVRSVHPRPRSETLATLQRLDYAPEHGRHRIGRRRKALSSVDSSHCWVRYGHSSPPPSPLASIISLPTPAPAVLHTPENEMETLGSFAPTNPSRHSLRLILAARLPLALSSMSRPSSESGVSRANDAICDTSAWDGSPMPPGSQVIPSICRTPSSYTGSEYFPTAPSSAGPPTPAREHSPSPKPLNQGLHPVLESLENSSKFKVA
ncbi:uncharacterized protein FIBRA_05674 [Fibroporia radiculosa]|uniref:Uncharacterized protein n=1 Tax=Fibroporia radiculosa TaxID=599839 RepID=J4GRF3_9APHY|nr:uncharacterized protein FIBRA_05674 [Fibroporia radiculosa]CCM03540.1 predicted protein [Fibroporia radiculosa]